MTCSVYIKRALTPFLPYNLQLSVGSGMMLWFYLVGFVRFIGWVGGIVAAQYDRHAAFA